MFSAAPRLLNPSATARNPLKVLLIVVYLASGHEQYRDRLLDLSLSPSLITSYGVLFAVLAAALLLGAFIRHEMVRWLFAILFTTSAVFCDSYIRITGDYLTYSIFISQARSVAFADEALQQYWRSIALASMWATLLLVGFGLRPRRRVRTEAGPTTGRDRRLVEVALIAAPVAGVMLLTAVLFMRGGAGARGLPVMFIPISYSKLFAYELMTESIGPRQAVSLPRADVTIRHDIVLVIDESVSGNYLDINAEHGVRTSLKEAPAGVRVYNFGYAAAVGSCSADVNLTLRFGGTREDYVRINASMPSIWQYAKVAGLQTVYIDAQRTGRRTQNVMTDWELNDVGQWFQFDDVSVRDRDMAVADKLAALVNDDTPQFILVNKMGVHFPVHDKFPDEFMHYRPVLPRGKLTEIGETGLRFGFKGDPVDWALYRNSYKNSLLWSVGNFFTRLFAKSRLEKAVLLYTSDHGQDLHERGNPGLNTHCGGRPVMEEGLVPLLVIQGSGLQTLDWEANLPLNRNASSHYNIFPTLLLLMGYELAPLRAVYGNPLSIATEDPFTFNTRFNGRMGAKPRWMFIDLNRIVTPPPS